jgi:hypothetical protein
MTPLSPEVHAANRRRAIVVLAVLIPIVLGIGVASAVIAHGVRDPDRPAIAGEVIGGLALGPAAALWSLVELVARVRSRARGTWNGRIWPWCVALVDGLLVTLAPGYIGLVLLMTGSALFAALVVRAGGYRRQPPPPTWPPPPYPPPYPPPGWPPPPPYPPPYPPPPAYPPPHPPTAAPPDAPPERAARPPEPPDLTPPAAHATPHRRRRECRSRGRQ